MHRDRAKVVASALIRFGAVAVTVGASLIGYQWFQNNAPRWEAELYPVVVDWTIMDWQRDDDGRWSALVSGNKVRPECIFMPEQNPVALVFTQFSPRGREVPLLFLDDDSPDSNRPPGLQTFGRWRVSSQTVQEGDDVTFAIRHRCHEGEPIVTVVGPLQIGSDYP